MTILTRTRRPHPTSVVPPAGLRIQPFEAASYGGLSSRGDVFVYVDQVDGFVVQCRRHPASAWWTATSEHARELVEAPYAWCDACRDENDAMTAALLRRSVKVWAASCKVREADEIQTYRVTGTVGQSRADVLDVGRRTFAAHGLQPIPGTVVAELVEA